jgi:hypothetical protein
MVGVFNQLSYGTICYNGMLSFYFLLTARFGYSNAYVSKVVEPWMHIISNGFAVITSVVALAIGAYGEMAHSNGCWVANYPRGCGGENGPVCTSRLIGWLYFGLPAILVLICLIINNSIIFMFVRRQTIPSRMPKQSSEGWAQTGSDESTSSFADEDGSLNLDIGRNQHESNDFSVADDRQDSKQKVQLTRDQARRLRLVCTQAFLYVAFFAVCNVWTGIVGIFERSGTAEKDELQIVVDHYIFYLLQAILAPLNGLVRIYDAFIAFTLKSYCGVLTFRFNSIKFNLFVFIRPKYHFCRIAFPKETRLWIVRRTILGSKVKRTFSSNSQSRPVNVPRVSPTDPNNGSDGKGAKTNMASATRLPRDMISSVTASEGDFDCVGPTTSISDGRWASDKDKGFGSILASVPRRFKSLVEARSSVLEVISEDAISTFEHSFQISITEELVMDTSSGEFSPANVEKRWASDSSKPSVTSSTRQSIPQRDESTIEDPDASSSFRHLNGSSNQGEHIPLPVDQPIKVPQRRSTPGSPPGSPPSREKNVREPELSSSLRRVTDTVQGTADVTLAADKPIKVPIRRGSLG